MKKREKKRLILSIRNGLNYNQFCIVVKLINKSNVDREALNRYLFFKFHRKMKGQKPFYFQQQMKKTLEFILK